MSSARRAMRCNRSLALASVLATPDRHKDSATNLDQCYLHAFSLNAMGLFSGALDPHGVRGPRIPAHPSLHRYNLELRLQLSTRHADFSLNFYQYKANMTMPSFDLTHLRCRTISERGISILNTITRVSLLNMISKSLILLPISLLFLYCT
jgi:hypothetical protein